MWRVRVLASAGVLVLAVGVEGRPQSDDAGLAAIVERVGEYVQQYLSVARTVLAREAVTLQPLDRNLRNEGRPRRFEYETRVEWEPDSGRAATSAIVHRELMTVDGREPRPGGDAGCLNETSPEPLAFLLPDRREAFTFTAVAGQRRSRGTIAFDFTPRRAGVPSLRWRGDCATFDLPGLIRGRVAADAATFVVRRVEQRLVAPVAIPVPREQRREGWAASIDVQRADVTVRYDGFQFRNPDERLWLPVEIERVTVASTPEAHRLRTTQRFSNYRRFVTGIRIQPPR